jgi:hypothetical protein
MRRPIPHPPLLASLAALALAAPRAGAQIPLHHWVGDRNELLGRCARDAGDVDGDGRDDVVLGGGTPLPVGPASRVAVRVRSGATGGSVLELRPQLAGAAFGWAVDGLDDIDADGHADLVVGSPAADFGAGRVGAVTAHSGASGAMLWQRAGSQLDVAFGYVLARAGDLDGDGLRDVIACGFDPSATPSGYVEALSGASGAPIWSASGSPGDGFGSTAATLGDVDGDGVDDVAVGAPRFGPTAPVPRGAVHVLSGVDGSTIRVVEGAFLDGIGLALAGPGDVDGDGRADVATAGSQTPTGVRLYSAFSGDLIRTLPAAGFLGRLGAAGDVDGDGTPDVLAPTFDGAVNVLSGADGSRLRSLFLHQPRADVFTLSLGGDLDGDGRRELLIGGLEVDSQTVTTPGGGEVLAYSGAPSSDVARSCLGDGSEGACPCDLPGSVGAGCGLWAPYPELRGARLLTEGSTSAAADDLRFVLLAQDQGLPALLLAGTDHTPPTPFGVGLRCAGGAVTRLALREELSGYATFGPGLGAVGGWSAGDRRTFQVWYRVAPENVPCSADAWNLSNAVDVRFGP